MEHIVELRRTLDGIVLVGIHDTQECNGGLSKQEACEVHPSSVTGLSELSV